MGGGVAAGAGEQGAGPHTALLRHFGSKKGLLRQAMESTAAEMYTQRWSAVPGDIEGAVEDVLDHYEERGERSLHVGAWLQTGSPLLANISQMARQMNYDWVEHAFGPQLARRHGDERRRCRAVLITLCDVHTWWLLARDRAFEHAAVKATLLTATRASACGRAFGPVSVGQGGVHQLFTT